ncbi:MAG TPA: hypothetical protein VIM73_04595 [Polyangiaceae bacterium]
MAFALIEQCRRFRTALGIETRVSTTKSAHPISLADRATIAGDAVSKGTLSRNSNTMITGSVLQTCDHYAWRVSLPASAGRILSE